MNRWPLLLLVGLCLTACGPAPTATPPPTASPTPLPLPTETAAPSPPPTLAQPSPTPRPRPPLVYEQDGNLWLYEGTSPHILIEDGRSYRPQVSPDGRTLLFRRREEPTELTPAPFSLWLLDLETGEERSVDLSALPPEPFTTAEGEMVELPRLPFDTVWLPDGSAVLLNTGVDYSAVMPGGGEGFADLWLVDPQSGTLRQLLPGEESPATFTLSPDGQTVLLNYADRIEAVDLESGERRLFLHFTPVPTYSEYRWLPDPRWLPEGRAAVVAIGPAEPMESATFTLWRLDVAGGEAMEIGQVEGSAFAWSPDGNSWSPDGGRLLYVQQVRRVLLTEVATGRTVEVAQGESPRVLGWSPDGQTALYADGPVVYGLTAGERPAVRRLVETALPAFLSWWDGDLFLFQEGSLFRVLPDGGGVEKVGP